MLTKSEKSKMGRPAMPKGTAKGVLFAVRVAEIEAEKIQAAIRKSGMSKPDWGRHALIQAAG